MSVLNKDRFIRIFHDQIGFIERSCRDFDQGNETESIRIATNLRTIFHDTDKSVSLISHLDFNNKKMLTSSREFGDWRDYLAHLENLNSPEPIRMIPMFGNTFQEISIQDWWEIEVVFIHNSKNYSRKKIVLSMANKDGGAHVDEKLEGYYKVLCAGEYAFGITGNLTYNGEPPFPQGVTIYPKNAHLALIRQFAHEFLTTVRHFDWLHS